MPKIVTKIENVTVNEGNDAQFICKFISNPNPIKLSWFKNDNEELVEDDCISFTNTENTSILGLKNCKASDTGSSFFVKVLNELGETNSNKANLIVNCGPNFISEPQDQKVLRDKEAKFECIIKSNPKPNVNWFLNGKELTIKDGVKIEKDGAKDKYVLIIPKVSNAHIGTISVRATNEYGTIEKNCLLELLDLPKILNKLDNVTVNENDQAKFSVKMTGNPKPSVKWFKDDVEIVIDESIEIIESEENEVTLIIKSCKSPLHSGNYFAKISNEFGEVSSNKSTLTIQSK